MNDQPKTLRETFAEMNDSLKELCAILKNQNNQLKEIKQELNTIRKIVTR